MPSFPGFLAIIYQPSNPMSVSTYFFVFRILAIFGLLSASCRADDISADRQFEVYKLPLFVGKDVNGQPFADGARVYLRAVGSKRPGTLLLENDRWIDVHWAPHSNILALNDGQDGHITDIYVYKVTQSNTRQPVATLIFRNFDRGYDVKWIFDRWSGNVLHLKVEELFHDCGPDGREDFGHTIGHSIRSVVLDFDAPNRSSKY